VIVETTLLVDGVATARGVVVAMQMPDSFGATISESYWPLALDGLA
jgi:hypothetical protein